MAEDNNKNRVAVIGSGIAGLSMAYLMQEHGYEVSIFEKYEEVGMDAHCVMVEAKDGSMFRLNTPPRSFSREYYPNLLELYRLANVDIEPWSWAWVAYFVGSYNPYVRVFKNFRFLGFSLPSYIDIFRPWTTFQIWREGIRFSKACVNDVENEKLRELTFGEYCDYLQLSSDFMVRALLPTLSMICTCSYEACLNYPAGLVIDFYARTATYGQYRTKNGTQDAVRQLTRKVSRVNVGCEIRRIFKGDNVNPQQEKSTRAKPGIEYVQNGVAKKEEFDVVIMATQANHASKIIQNLEPELLSLLQSFEHETSQVVIHRDERVMPGNSYMWSPMSIGVLDPSKQPDGKSSSMFTIWMNDSFPNIKGNLFQTWNPVIDIAKEHIVDEPITFERPIMTKQSLAAVDKLEKFQGHGGIYYCGAWNARRIPLQESGVVSALRILKQINGEIEFGKWVTDDDEYPNALRKVEASKGTNVFLKVGAIAALAFLAIKYTTTNSIGNK